MPTTTADDLQLGEIARIFLANMPEPIRAFLMDEMFPRFPVGSQQDMAAVLNHLNLAVWQMPGPNWGGGTPEEYARFVIDYIPESVRDSYDWLVPLTNLLQRVADGDFGLPTEDTV